MGRLLTNEYKPQTGRKKAMYSQVVRQSKYTVDFKMQEARVLMFYHQK